MVALGEANRERARRMEIRDRRMREGRHPDYPNRRLVGYVDGEPVYARGDADGW